MGGARLCSHDNGVVHAAPARGKTVAGRGASREDSEPTAVTTLRIAPRFRGPPASGNGGYVCGCLARHLPGPLTVRLKLPPPIDRDLRVETSAGGVTLLDGSVEIANARQSTLNLTAPPAPSYEDAAIAARSYGGFRDHAFPHCFVCGPAREPGDGLRLFPGPAGDGGLLAAPWIPDASLAAGSTVVSREFLWAALDCPGGHAVMPAATDRAILLGELCARIDGDVHVGEQCVVAGWPLRIDGRKRYAGSAVYGGDGRPVAIAQATWIEVSRSEYADH